MAINNNVQNIQFLRNQTLFETRDLALQALENNKAQAADGTALLARYSVSGGVKTIVGFVYGNGTNNSMTIFDTEGAAANVEELRQEINAKLGTGITSSNTATAQLAALSGNGQSTSAETSVEGAKRYADALKTAMDYTGVTTGTGVYVTNVTETDGIVSATTATLPSVTDTKEAKKVVVSVSEDKGQISIERGTISSSAETMVLTDNTDGGVNFEVNIDNNTIIQDAETKKLKVADAALVQYEGDTKTIAISQVQDGVRTVSSIITLSSVTPSSTTVREEYALKNASGETIGSTIKIYKDSSLYRVYLGHVDDTIASPTDPTVVPGTSDTALCFIYLKTDGTYELVAVNVEEFIEENEFASGVTWDGTAKKVKGVVDPNSESFFTVGANGFKVAGISAHVQSEIEKLDATVTGGTTAGTATSNHVQVIVGEADGKLTGVTVTETNIADKSALEALSGKTFTVATSSNDSITTAVTAAADGTKSVDLITDADKIKMSGFTADSASALSGIVTSDSIATAFEKTNTVITENERVTAEALTDLDTRVDTIESGYVETVKVNNVALAETNNAVNIQISAATSAATPSGNEAIVVTTNNETGAITLGIANIDAGFYD